MGSLGAMAQTTLYSTKRDTNQTITLSEDHMATVERRPSSRTTIAIANESQSDDYAASAKRLISVIQRLQQWFCGEKLFQAAKIQTETQITFRWNYQSRHFEWCDCGKWRKVINPKRPDIMVQFIPFCRELHDRARLAKSNMSETLKHAADEGEKYLTLLSKHPDLSGPL
jgi:hypothetical protein